VSPKRPCLRLDENAAAPVHDGAWRAYERTWRAHDEHATALAQTQLAQFLNCAQAEIRFTSGGTEADAAAILGVVTQHDKPHVVSSTIEHAAVMSTLASLEKSGRIRWSRVPASRTGLVNATDMAAAMQDDTRLCCLILASNETGVVQPVQELADICARKSVHLHSDAVQAAGRIPLDVARLGVSSLALSGHKLGAVPGVGALYVRGGCDVNELLPNQSFENYPGAAAMGASVLARPDAQEVRHLRSLRDLLERGLGERIADIEILGAQHERLCNTTCIRFARCEGDGIMMALDLEGIAVSTGSACASGSIEASPILMGMGLSAADAKQCVRFSLSQALSKSDVERVIEVTTGVVARIRS